MLRPILSHPLTDLFWQLRRDDRDHVVFSQKWARVALDGCTTFPNNTCVSSCVGITCCITTSEKQKGCKFDMGFLYGVSMGPLWGSCLGSLSGYVQCFFVHFTTTSKYVSSHLHLAIWIRTHRRPTSYVSQLLAGHGCASKLRGCDGSLDSKFVMRF